MFEWIKRHLFKHRYHKVKTTLDKIDYILKHKIDYRELYEIQCYFAYDSIKRYNHILDNMLKQDLTTETIAVDELENPTVSLEFLYWCNNGVVFDNDKDQHMLTFLKLSKEFIEYVNMYKAARIKQKSYYYNLRVLETHIIYLDGIIDKIYNTSI